MQFRYCQISAFDKAPHFVMNGILNEIIKINVISLVYEMW